MSFRKCVMRPAHNTPTLPISCLERLAKAAKFPWQNRRLSACLEGRWYGQTKDRVLRRRWFQAGVPSWLSAFAMPTSTPLETRYLLAAVALAEELSFTGAAKRLKMSQSGVSRRSFQIASMRCGLVRGTAMRRESNCGIASSADR